MVKIEVTIVKDRFHEVYKVLEPSGIGGMTVSEVRGFGQHRKGLEERVRLDIYAEEFQVDAIVEMISRVVKSSESGDGKIAILPLGDLYHIRTGEQGEAAI